jgi:anti-sigma factor RsiW
VSCKDTQDLIHGYVDGELDLVQNLQIERHLGECYACAEMLSAQRTLRATIRKHSLYFQPPTGLEKRVRSALRQASGAGSKPLGWMWLLAWRGPALAVSFALVAVVSFSIARFSFPVPAEDMIAQQVVSSHIRSLMEGHLTDVPSSNQHTVKPWFSGKLDFSPAVKDLDANGFSLVGGRLDYLDSHPVAALIYERRKHFVNLFVWRSAGRPDSAGQSDARQGYNMIHWTRSGMSYWVASDLNLSELQEFVKLIEE